MSKFRRYHLVPALVFLASLAFVAVGYAVKSFSDGNDYVTSGEEYQFGHVAGALDMLAALQDAGKLQAGSFSEQSGQIVQCTENKKLRELHKMYVDCIAADPQKKQNNVASSLYFAVKAACKI
jgi:hypothetical protein